MQAATSLDAPAPRKPWSGSPDPLAREQYLETLGEAIAGLSAHIEAATWRLLRSISEFDRLEGWGAGFTSCGHWLSWRCHWDMITAREKVRVARALDNLPHTSEALRKGRVSSNVRAISRVATPANEKELLHIALNGTACHVERVVRGGAAPGRGNRSSMSAKGTRNVPSGFTPMPREWSSSRRD